MANKKPLVNNGGEFSQIDSGDAIDVASGGTGLSSYTTGNFLYASGTSTIGQRTPSQVLSDIGALLSSSYTASDVLTKLLTVDGIGSGLDADLLDGQHGTYYLDATNLTGTINVARSWALTGDVTSPAGSATATIANNAVTLAKMATITTASLLGRSTAGTGNVEVLTLGTGLSLSAGVLSATNTSAGTVTAVSVTTANGVSGSVATSTTTPAITLTLGAITPTSVAASGTVTGSNLSGTNTGNQTITLTGNVTGSGTGSFATTIGAGVVTLAMQANVATGTVFYRKTAATGVPEVQTLATLKTDLGLTGTNTGDQTITLTGNVTGSGTGSFATTIAANAVTLANLAQVATGTFLGRTTAATGNVEALTVAQAKTLLALVKSDVGLSAVENTALSTWAGTTSITTLGTIATGTWNGTAIADGKIASALTGKTYNGLTLTASAVGFTLAGGTTSKTLTVGLDASVSGSNTGDQTTVTGNAGTATTLQTARTIAISGKATGTATSFNGSANITIPITAVSLDSGDITSALGFTPYNATNPSGYTANTGTVTSTSVTTANGVSGSVATSTTTPALTITLGDITPTSVAASGTVSDSVGNVRTLGNNVQNSSYTLLTSDFGKVVEKTGTGAINYTLSNIGGAGDMITVINSSSSGDITVVRSSTTIYTNNTNANLVVTPGTMRTLVRTSVSGRWQA